MYWLLQGRFIYNALIHEPIHFDALELSILLEGLIDSYHDARHGNIARMTPPSFAAEGRSENKLPSISRSRCFTALLLIPIELPNSTVKLKYRRFVQMLEGFRTPHRTIIQED